MERLRQRSSHLGTPIEIDLSSRALDELAASMAGVRMSLEAALARQVPRLSPSSSHGHSPGGLTARIFLHAITCREAQQASTHRR